MNEIKDDLALKVALMYYVENKKQCEISTTLNISRSYVSQLLYYARNNGIVKISVNMNKKSLRAVHKEIEFKKLFPWLKQCFIMESSSEEFTAANMGRFAAPHLAEVINEAKIIGITPGLSVDKTMEHLRGQNIQFDKERAVVQMMGSFNISSIMSYAQPNEIVKNLSNVLKCSAYYLNCPALITQSELRLRLLREKSIQEIIKVWDKIDLVIMGLGVADDRSRLFSFYDEDCCSKIKQSNACGEINTHHFDINGRYLPLIENRTICTSMDKLKKVLRKVVICSGAFKNKALLGALRGGYIDVLITDSLTIEATERLLLAMQY